jgi:class 3 adenylate cyclase
VESETVRTWLGRDFGSIALVFTDIYDSTSIALDLGEYAWMETLKRHFDSARHYLELYGGFEVKLIGDACMVAFHTPAQALRFAFSLFEDTGDPLIAVKIGIHFGSIQVLENDIYGLMVNYTARVQHLLKSSGIAFSRAVRDELKVMGPELDVLGKVTRLQHDGIKSFGPEDQEVFQLLTEDLRMKHRNERRARYEREQRLAHRSRSIRQIAPRI